MIESTRKLKRKPGITATNIDDEIVMIDMSQNKYFALNAVGAFIWNRLEQPQSIAELCDSVLEEFDISREDCTIEIQAFARRMHEASLVEVIE